MLEAIAVGLVLFGLILAFGLSSWRRSEERYERWERRRGEDEDPDRTGRPLPRDHHWGGWGRPGR